jgi:hypothetical protein
MNQQNEENLPQGEPDVVSLLLKMQQQLLYLERKIDTLINTQSSSRPAERFSERRERSFDKPYRPFTGKPKFYSDKKQGSSFGGEKKSYGEKREYGDKKREFSGKKSFGSDKPAFDKKRKPYGKARDR